VEDGAGLGISTRSSNQGSVNMNVTTGGSVEAINVFLGNQATVTVGTLGNPAAALSTITAGDVDVVGQDARLVINDRGRVDTDFIQVGFFGDGGTIEVNEGGLLVIPGGTANFPLRGIVGSTGTLDVTGGGRIMLGNQLANPTSFEDTAIHLGLNGRLRADAGSQVFGDVFIHNQGNLVANGTVTGNVQINAGGLLDGDGVIVGNVNVDPFGQINPGNSIGTLTIEGDLTLDENSILTIEVNSLGNDQIVVTGTLTLGGELNIAFIDGFSPELGQSLLLDIFTDQVQIGEGTSFAGFSVSGLADGLSLDADLDAVAQGQAVGITVVPEPASLALLALGSLLLAHRRRSA
jgi:fibronectin-binding autotransporter adhesin